MMAISTVTLSSITLAMTWSPAGPHRIFGDATALAAVAVCMALAVLWACRWPTQRQSVCYALSVLTCTAIVCLSYSDRLFGLLGCMSFAVLGGYIAFFHSARLLVVNLAVASSTALTLAVMLAATTEDLVRAVCAFLEVAVALRHDEPRGADPMGAGRDPTQPTRGVPVAITGLQPGDQRDVLHDVLPRCRLPH